MRLSSLVDLLITLHYTGLVPMSSVNDLLKNLRLSFENIY